MIHLFCGYDARESIGFHVFVSSVLRNCSVPVAIQRIDSMGQRCGSNEFTFSRFLVAYAMGFKGWAIFADASDMLLRGDLAELAKLYDPSKALQCVKHEYKTRNSIKYIGTDMQCFNRNYPRKNWASLMLINCEHPSWRAFTPQYVAAMSEAPSALLGLKLFPEDEIGGLPAKWNCLVDEGQEHEGAALLHWTAGIPAFKHYADAPCAAVWRAYRDVMTGTDA